MKKEDLKIFGLLITLILLSGFIGFATGIYSNETSIYTVDDDYQTISFRKDYKILELNEHLEDGEQYDYLTVDWYRPWNRSADIFSDSYGLIRVNESSGKLEFIEWRTSKSVTITVVEEGNTSFDNYDIWYRFCYPIPQGISIWSVLKP